MIFEILNEAGGVVSRIVADQAFVDAHYPGHSRLVPPQDADIDELASKYLVAVQGELDRAANRFGYDSMAVAVTYAEEPAVPRFQAEGRALRAWRSIVWEACYAILAQVKASQRPVPTQSALLAELPPPPLQG